jgi:hypothetical protein
LGPCPASVAVGFEIFAGAATFAAGFVSLCFESAGALGDDAAGLTGFRTVVLLRAVVLFVVAFVAIRKI